MRVYQSKLDGTYCAGLAIIYANSVQEAIDLLQKKDDWITIEGVEYPNDDFISTSYVWSKPVSVDDITTTEITPQIKFYEKYIE